MQLCIDWFYAFTHNKVWIQQPKSSKSFAASGSPSLRLLDGLAFPSRAYRDGKRARLRRALMMPCALRRFGAMLAALKKRLPMSDALDFSGLTSRKEWLLLYQGWRTGQKFPDGSPWPQPQRRTVRNLIDRGLMKRVEVSERAGPLKVTVIEYHVPLHVHAAFCLHSSQEEPTHV